MRCRGVEVESTDYLGSLQEIPRRARRACLLDVGSPNILLDSVSASVSVTEGRGELQWKRVGGAAPLVGVGWADACSQLVVQGQTGEESDG